MFVVLALLVWELVALCVGAPYIVPAPQDVLARGAELIATATFWQAVGWSLLRVLVGFACGMVCGIALAVPMAAWPGCEPCSPPSSRSFARCRSCASSC